MSEPAGVYEAMQLAEASARGPFWKELQEARALVGQLQTERERGEWCAVCGNVGRGRIRVHRECVIHKHVEVDGVESIIPRPQEDWADLWGRAETAEALVERYREDLAYIHAEAESWLRFRGDPEITLDDIYERSALVEHNEEETP